MDSFGRTARVCLDASSRCQLHCPSCPTAAGKVEAGIGSGWLAPEDFATFVLHHPWIREIELSNWGEVFLNPGLPAILRLAHEAGVTITIDNGANLNHVRTEALEAVVRYRVASMTCSIDGTTQASYEQYRQGGRLDRVLANLDRLIALKRQLRSDRPVLHWQFVVFGHNEHEITTARMMARERGMTFGLKLNWQDLYGQEASPIRDRARIRRETGLPVADRREYEARFGRHYMENVCLHLWLNPNIHHDGKLLGCTINHGSDFGNVFVDGLETCLAGERYRYAQAMLMGRKPERADLPCTHCRIYQSRKRNHAFVTPEQLRTHGPGKHENAQNRPQS